MKRTMLGCLLLSCSLLMAVDDDFTLESVSLVQKRNYIIRRLEESVKNFSAIYAKKTRSKPAEHGPILDAHVISLLRHPVVQRAAQDIITQKSMQPFYRVWNHVLSYRFIDDMPFIRETVTLLLFLYNHLMVSLLAHNQLEDVTTLRRHYPELTNVLAQGHHMDSDLCNDIPCNNVHENISSLITLLDDSTVMPKKDFVVCNNRRFYHIQRLLCALFILSKEKQTAVDISDQIARTFRHERIKLCAQAMSKERTIIPLFKMWKSFIAYDCIDDTLFVHDFMCLVIMVYNQLLTEQATTRGQEQFAGVDSIELYQKISGLPVSELLLMVDEISEKFSVLSEKYELTNQQLSWSAWFKHYWWSIPVFAKAVGATLSAHALAVQQVVQVFFKRAGTIS